VAILSSGMFVICLHRRTMFTFLLNYVYSYVLPFNRSYVEVCLIVFHGTVVCLILVWPIVMHKLFGNLTNSRRGYHIPWCAHNQTLCWFFFRI
jgi:hypothetical protein